MSDINKAAKTAQASEFVKKFASGIDSDIAQGGANVSGGQKQRLAIARAIVNNPRIIFADEPTGNLDSTTGEKVEKLLFGLNKQEGSTLVIVTHDIDLAKKCDMQIYIKDGKVAKITSAARKGVRS